MNNCKADIKKQGALNQDYVNTLIKHLKGDRHIPPKFKKDIFGYLRETGFKVS
jgi:hypothetical protein